MYKLLSFDVYGTLINTPPINVKAFRLILEQAGAPNIDALTFYQFWESRNIVHYREPYRSYREIGELSLEEAFENFGVVGGTADLIERYFELFAEIRNKRVGLPEEFHTARPKRLRFLLLNTVGKVVRHAREILLRCTKQIARALAGPPRTRFSLKRPALVGV